jgi:hypothetical protein
MRLILVYVGIVLVGLLISYGVGRTVEHWSETTSLFVFLAMFFGTLWAGWQLATRIV